MNKKMLINATEPDEIRVAVVHGGAMEGFYVETAAREQTRGNIYKGVVTNIENSLQAAFINYGASRNGFLQVSDLCPAIVKPNTEAGKTPRNIREFLRVGQEVLVQVVKEETGNKGASLTTYFSIPGQYLVLTPGHDAQGVSRNISSDTERERIRKALADLKRPAGLGVIARTDAEGRSKREIQNNFQQLIRLWTDIKRRGDKAKAPQLIHKEEELAVRTVRDLFTSDVKEILVDNSEVYERIRKYLGVVSPRRKSQLRLYKDHEPIFQRYQLEQQIMSVYQPVVELPCGGSIVIHPTEALVSIDVNSGRAHGGRKIEETALNVNIEAAVEVARQLRLRDLGGLVVVDFIDMRDRANQRAVRKKLSDELKMDKAKTAVGAISRFGLLELSRQRIRPPIDFGATMVCPHCGGKGVVKTPEAIGRNVLRSLERRLTGREKGGVRVRMAQSVAHYLLNARRQDLYALEQRNGIVLELVGEPGLNGEEMHVERFEAAWAPPQPLEKVCEQAAEDAPSKREPSEPDGDKGKSQADQPKKSGPAKRRRGGRRRPRKKDPEPLSDHGGDDKKEVKREAKGDLDEPEKPHHHAQSESTVKQAEEPPAKKRRRRSNIPRRRNKLPNQWPDEQQGIVPLTSHDEPAD